MTIFPGPSEWVRSGNRHAAATPFAGGEQHYFAFLSYSHRDSAMASWLHDALEKYRAPLHLVGRVTDQGPVPRRLTPIFRDLGELPASADLNHEIKSALAASRFLIVLCSPAAAKSRWTNAEIEAFKRVRPDGCVFAVIVAGEPFASDIPGREDEECLPRALRFKYDRRGRATSKRAEPLAADLREPGEVRRLGFLKLVAGMLGVGLDDLVRREAVRRHRHMAAIAGASLMGMVVASALALAALQGRDEARDQRREAESLVGFMLGDLRTKLEPVGRLDVLDSVASRALAYYQNQDTSELSDEGLAQRYKALTLMGELANTRGDLGAALRFYQAAFAGTKEALNRAPDNPQRMFDHAQNVFWIGDIDRQRGNLDAAQSAFREYARLADEMVAAEPGNTKWRLEQTYANNALGVLLLRRARHREASGPLGEALRVSEALVAIEPKNVAFQDRLIEALAWFADVREKAGSLDEALRLRRRQLAFLEQLKPARGDDATLKRKSMTAHRAIGRLFASRGDTARGLAAFDAASALAQDMLRTDASNTEWTQFAADILLDRGELQLAINQIDSAGASAHAGCDVARRLAARDPTVVWWRAILPGKCLALRAQLALAGGEAEAKSLAEQLVQLARGEAERSRSVEASFTLARAELLRGDVASRMGDRAAAQVAWRAAAAAWPNNVELTPHEIAVRAHLLRRLGAFNESRALTQRLASIGYRHPAFLKE